MLKQKEQQGRNTAVGMCLACLSVRRNAISLSGYITRGLAGQRMAFGFHFKCNRKKLEVFSREVT